MQKYSKQREALVSLLQHTKSHPSADALYLELKKEFPKISLATVYRNLNSLLEQNEIIKIDIGNGTEHYDACVDPHYHFVCEHCSAIIDLDVPVRMELLEEVSKETDMVIHSHTVLFYGICKKCQEK